MGSALGLESKASATSSAVRLAHACDVEERLGARFACSASGVVTDGASCAGFADAATENIEDAGACEAGRAWRCEWVRGATGTECEAAKRRVTSCVGPVTAK